MEYTPSVTNSQNRNGSSAFSQHLLPSPEYYYQNPAAFQPARPAPHQQFNEEDTILDTAAAIEEQFQRGPPRPSSASSQGSRSKGRPDIKHAPNISQSSVATAGFNLATDTGSHINMPMQQARQPSPVRVQITQQSLVEKLTDKMKIMAEKIIELEAYKTLCEKRIRELDPGHYLPVQAQHLGQRPNSIQQVDQLQQKLVDMQTQVVSQHEYKRRLQHVEESLRNETLINEEQRAYIQVLRESLELKLTQNGLQFKGTSLTGIKIESNIDGFIQLISAQRVADSLRADNTKLIQSFNDLQQLQERKELDIVSRFQTQIEENHRVFSVQMQQLEDRFAASKDKKRKLKGEKNQLLDFVEENVQKQQNDEATRKKLQAQLYEAESHIKQISDDRDILSKDKDNLEDLIKQTQQNVRQMRDEKERHTTQIQQLTNQIQDLEGQLRDGEDLMRDMEEQLKLKQNELQAKDHLIQEKDNEAFLAKNEYERNKQHAQEKQATIEAFRSQLDDSYLKSKSLQESNTKLQMTLRESQDELDRLVKQYEALSQAIASSERELAQSRKQNQEMRRELDDRNLALAEYRERDVSRERELQELYQQVSQKDHLMNEFEKRLVRNLKEKESENNQLQKKIEILDAEKRDETAKVEFLERVNEDRSQEVTRVKQVADHKNNHVEELQIQLKRIKEEGERNVSMKVNDKEKMEIEFNIRASQIQEELKVMREQKNLAERLLMERAESIRVQEEEIIKKEDKLRRWEREISRLEDKAIKETEKSICVQGEFERLRSMRVDDALLIERLRSSQSDIQDSLNEIIGVLAAFTNHIESDDHLCEQLNEQILQLRPLRNTDEIVGAMREIRQCISTIIIFAKGQRKQSKKRHIASPLENSPPQKEEWNMLQRISGFTIDNHEYDDSHYRQFSKLQPSAENIKICIDQIHEERNKHIQLKLQIEGTEDQLNTQKLHIVELEQVIKKITHLKSLNSQISKTLLELFSHIQDLSIARYDKSCLLLKLKQKENRVLTLTNTSSLSNLSTNYQKEISMLKSSIDRDKIDVKQLESRVDALKRKQGDLFEDLLGMDSAIGTQDDKQDFKVHGMNQEIDELKKANRLLHDEKDWHANRFTDLEEQLGKFNLPVNQSLRQKSAERSPIQDQGLTNRDNSRLYWPRMSANKPEVYGGSGQSSLSRRIFSSQDQNNSSIPPRGLNRGDSISFGQIHDAQYLRKKDNNPQLSNQEKSLGRDEYTRHNLLTPVQRINMLHETPVQRFSAQSNGNNLDYVPSLYKASRGGSEQRSDSGIRSAYDKIQSSSLQDKMTKVKNMFSILKKNIVEN